MPAKDLVHDAAKEALKSDHWEITHDPLYIRVGTFQYVIDLGAETLLAAERGEQKLLLKSKVLSVHLQLRNFIQR